MAIIKKGKTYVVRIWYDRKDIRKRIGPDRKMAEAVEAALKKEIAQAKAAGLPWTGLSDVAKAKKPKTFAEAAKDYMDERVTCKPSTIAAYESILSVHLIPEFGKQALRAITEMQIAKFQARLSQPKADQKKGLSGRRVNTIMQLFRNILHVAARRGDIASDPSKAVKPAKELKHHVDPLSETELNLALNTIDKHYRPLFTTLGFTGMRPNEAIALRWSDIDWNRKQISISKGRVRGMEGAPKTDCSYRTIPMVARVEDALRSIKGVASLDDYIFLDKKGQPIEKHLDRIWLVGLKKAGIRHRASYQLRHTFASQCLEKGLAPAYIAKLLGHSTLETFYRYYAAFIKDSADIQESLLREKLDGASSKHLAQNLAVVS